jgi:TPR repeat protein
MCAGKDVRREEDAKLSFFFSWPRRRSRAMLLLAVLAKLIEREDSAPLRRSAELGFGCLPSICLAGRYSRRRKGSSLLKLAAAQGERDGLFLAWLCVFAMDKAVKRTSTMAKKHFLRASELGHVSAMIASGRVRLTSLDPSDGDGGVREQLLDCSSSFLSKFVNQV